MAPPGEASGGAALLSARLRRADLLYQVDALDAATECLDGIARTATDADAKICALARMVQIDHDVAKPDKAHEHLSAALAEADHASGALGETARGELLGAQVRWAFSNRNTREVEDTTRKLWSRATRAGKNDRLWALAARACVYASVNRYAHRQIGSAVESCERAATAIGSASVQPPFVQTHVLTTRAVVDFHDPERVHLAAMENIGAYTLALEHGMVGTACDALFNILIFSVYCDEPVPAADGGSFALEVLGDATARAISANDAMLAAAAAATCGRFDEAIAFIDRARAEYHEDAFDWSPTFTTLEARILFKAARFPAAERAAVEAARDWERTGLGGEGAALRIRAEALEAMGERTTAVATIQDALDALQPHSPVHHLLGAYRCAYRLTHNRDYFERFDYLNKAVRKTAPIAVAPPLVSAPPKKPSGDRLTPRERDVARLVADGHTNPEIARALGIARKTVANHVAAIFERLDLRARWQLTRDLIADD